MEITVPFFKNITGSNMTPSDLINSGMWIWLILIFIIGSILSGLYPAFVLSSYKPVIVLKGAWISSTKGSLLRKVLVVFQFSISVTLIAGTIIVFNQMNYLQNKKLGINIDQTFVLNGPRVFESDSLSTLAIETFKQQVTSLADVKSFTASTNVPGVEIFWGQGSFSEDQQPEDGEVMYLVGIDHNFIESFELPLLSGTSFTPNLEKGMTEALVNRAAVKRYGYNNPEDIIGKIIYISRDSLQVKGVIENFNQMSLKTNVIPLAFPLVINQGGFFSMKVSTANIQSTISQIQQMWEDILPGNPFDYFFLDEHFNMQYAKDIQFGKVFGIFSGLAIFIACLGLFALASFSAIQRTKEIGVRKVLGASVKSIVSLLAKDFLKLVGVSILIAIPAIYFIMNLWLQNFAYRISISVWTLLFSSVIVSFIAILTIAYQTIKTAISNPVKALKYE